MISEAKWTRLRLEGYTGPLQDMFMAFLVFKGYTTGSIQDRELLWLRGTLSATATNIGDAWSQVFIANGYAGARNEAEDAFWVAHVL